MTFTCNFMSHLSVTSPQTLRAIAFETTLLFYLLFLHAQIHPIILRKLKHFVSELNFTNDNKSKPTCILYHEKTKLN